VSRSQTPAAQASAVGPFSYEALPARVVFAPGARSRVAEELDRLGVSRVLVIASARDEQLVGELCRTVGARLAGRFDAVATHVPIEVAEAARALARSVDADCVLTLGGGSATGTAKAIALDLPLPIVAVPTTYAGSEMTPIWGLTEANRKTTGRARQVLPTTVIYDPELTLSMPLSLAGPSAMNALAHCVEALYAPGANPVCSVLAGEGIRALAHGIKAVVAEPGEVGGRSLTLYGAYLAGVCLAGAGTALHHRICHVLGGAFDLPHAELHTVVLPQVVAFLEPAAQPQLQRAVEALDLRRTSELAGALFDLAQQTGAPSALSQIGLGEPDLDEATNLVLASDPPTQPRPIDRDELSALLSAALVGARPT
jgi:alcohol dehydrogenase class IV